MISAPETHLDVKKPQDSQHNNPAKQGEFHYKNLCEQKDQAIKKLSNSNDEKEQLIQHLKNELEKSKKILTEKRKQLHELAPRKISAVFYTEASSSEENPLNNNNNVTQGSSSSPQSLQTAVFSKTETLPRFQEFLKISDDQEANEFHYKHLIKEKDQAIDLLSRSNNEKKQFIENLETQIEFVRATIDKFDKQIKDLESPKKPYKQKIYTEIPHSVHHYQFNSNKEPEKPSPSFEAPLVQLPQPTASPITNSLPSFQEFLRTNQVPSPWKLENDHEKLCRLANSLPYDNSDLKDYANEVIKFSKSPDNYQAQTLVKLTRALINKFALMGGSYTSTCESLKKINPLLQALNPTHGKPQATKSSPSTNNNFSTMNSIEAHQPPLVQPPSSKKPRQEAPSNIAPSAVTFKPRTQTSLNKPLEPSKAPQFDT
jgi:hypothetical protein